MNGAEFEIRDFLAAGVPVMFCPTVEYYRAEEKIRAALIEVLTETNRSPKMTMYRWKVIKGLVKGNLTDGVAIGDSGEDIDAVAALERMEKSTEPILMVLHNVRQFITDPGFIQSVIDAAYAGKTVGSHLFIIGPSMEIPPELRHVVTSLSFPLPDSATLYESFKSWGVQHKNSIIHPDGSGWMKTGYKDERVKTLRAAARAASGMDLLSAETAFAVSVAKTASIDSSIIYAMKRKEIEKSDVLEFLDTTETMEDLGGFKALKFWMEKRRDVFSEEARSYGLSYPKGVLLCGIPGCLSGDTKILIYRPNGGGGRFETLEELYYRFNRKNKEGIDIGVLSAYKRPWAPGRVIETSSLDEQSKCAFKNVIESVVYSGVKDVFRLTTEDGYTIKATKDHKFYTPEGIYVPLAELRRGGFIVTKNTREGGVLVDDFRKGRNSIPSQRMISGVGNHPHARRKSINGLDYFTYPLAALVIEAHLNRLSLEAFLYALSGDIKGLTFIDPILEIHHKDRNRLNNILNNLEPLTTAEHARLHMEEDGNLMNKYQTMGRIQKVSSIDLVGPERTYDIQMRGPYHNFMADGFVVHNSGKSLAAKAIARFLGLKVIKLDLGRVFRSFVGESEGAIRYALQVADAAAPIILWIDEIEKGMAGVQSSGDSDSGIAARVMGTILTWSQERKSSVMMVATANNVFKLPSEVTRKGRFDEIWATALPTLEEREEIFAIHLRKRKRDPEQFNVAAFAERADNFVGAEIEAIVESSLVDAFSDGGRELQDSDVLRAIGETTPQSKRDSEAFSKILDWTEKRARQVSEPVDDAVASKIRKIRAVPNKPVENEEEDI